jgi:excisionase family DNA binding protein
MKNNEFLTVKEASEYLKINEKKLYELATKGLIPATKATGKWLFPIESLEYFLKQNALKNIKTNVIENLIDNGLILFAGSDDIILNKIFNEFHNKYPEIEIYYSSVGSFKGLQLLKNNQCHGAMSHIFNKEAKDYNFITADKLLGSDSYTIINLFYRDVGFVSKNKEINSFKEITENNLEFINRQRLSGIRNLSDLLIENIDTKNLKIFKEEMSTHFDVSKTVYENNNTVGIACKMAASIFGLTFSKILEERFDLIIRKEIFFKENFQTFIKFLRNNIQKKYENITGYKFKNSGEIMFKKNKCS